MRVLLNFYPVQSGGGQQVASNFIKSISKNNFGHEWFVFVGEGSELHEQAERYFKSNNILILKYSYLDRIVNIITVKNFANDKSIEIIYNFAPVLPIKNIPQVVRSVYSNLFFPEIDFWGKMPLHKKTMKKAIDYFRLKGTLKANGLIFENKGMQIRSNKLFNYPLNKTIYIHPSVTVFDEDITSGKYSHLELDVDFKILYLSSWYQNKNITILPKVAKILRDRQLKFKFVLTLDSTNPDVNLRLVSQINALKVSEYFEFIGQVKAIHVHQVIKSCDSMILLSKLECFSSNIIEAFFFNKPLIISDEIWAKEACQNAAIYVDRDSPKDIAESIIKLFRNKELQDQLTTEGNKLLNEFNTPYDKVKKQVMFLEKIYEEY